MSQHSPAPARRPSTGLWALIIVILLPAVVLPLWVPLYDKTDPTLFGFPFFFWFQFLLIIVVTSLTGFCYWLSLLAERKTREEHGLEGRP